MHQPEDPLLPFALSPDEGRVTKFSSRSIRLVTDKSSALGDGGHILFDRLQYDEQRPIRHEILGFSTAST